MNPKKKLPDGSEEILRQGEYLIIKNTLNKKPYYSIYKFYESSKGTRYWPRGASNSDLTIVKKELERITGRKQRKATN
jgi:hypothetical protein